MGGVIKVIYSDEGGTGAVERLESGQVSVASVHRVLAFRARSGVGEAAR